MPDCRLHGDAAVDGLTLTRVYRLASAHRICGGIGDADQRADAIAHAH